MAPFAVTEQQPVRDSHYTVRCRECRLQHERARSIAPHDGRRLHGCNGKVPPVWVEQSPKHARGIEIGRTEPFNATEVAVDLRGLTVTEKGEIANSEWCGLHSVAGLMIARYPAAQGRKRCYDRSRAVSPLRKVCGLGRGSRMVGCDPFRSCDHRFGPRELTHHPQWRDPSATTNRHAQLHR